MKARWLVAMLAAMFACGKKPKQAPPADEPHHNATGHSITKLKGVDDDGSGGSGGSGGSAGATASRPAAKGPPIENVTAVSVGGDRACAIADRKLGGWGGNDAQ